MNAVDNHVAQWSARRSRAPLRDVVNLGLYRGTISKAKGEPLPQ
jgi:hypothetical protein